MAIATHNLCFFHIPRTGGTWFNSFLYSGLGVKYTEYGGQHCTPSRYAKFLAAGAVPDMRDHFKFTIIREPSSWLRSMWQSGLLKHEPDKPPFHMPAEILFPQLRKDSWEAFLDDYLSRGEPLVTEGFKAYTDGVQYVGHTEDLRGCMMHVLGRIVGDFVDVPVNRTPERLIPARAAEYLEGQAEDIRRIEGYEHAPHQMAAV